MNNIYNKLSISGRLIESPNVVYTKTGKVANIKIKVDDIKSKGYDIFQADIWQEDFIKQLEKAFENQEIKLSGSHNRRSYIDKRTGEKIYYWSMSVDEMELMDICEIEESFDD